MSSGPPNSADPQTGDERDDGTGHHPIPGGELAGDLAVCDQPVGIVVFAHGSGSLRHSTPAAVLAMGLLSLRGALITLASAPSSSHQFSGAAPTTPARRSVHTDF
jgi:hypothetical protein